MACAKELSTKSLVHRVSVSVIDPISKPNFPEFLAEDLERSAAIFAKKDMTAGIPAPPLSSGESDKAARLEYSGGLPATTCISISQVVPHNRTLSKVNDISFTEAGADIKDNKSTVPSDSSSDYASVGSSNIGQSSRQIREHSVYTATTSLTSASYSVASQKHNPWDNIRTASWVDLEPDLEEFKYQNGDALSSLPQPSTVMDTENSQSLQLGSEAMTGCELINRPSTPTNGTWNENGIKVDPVATAKDIKRQPHQSTAILVDKIPKRQSSLRQRDCAFIGDSLAMTPDHGFTSTCPSNAGNEPGNSASMLSTVPITMTAQVVRIVRETHASPVARSFINLGDASFKEDEDGNNKDGNLLDDLHPTSAAHAKQRGKQENPFLTRRPQRTRIQPWLDTAMEVISSPLDENCGPGIPLPPEVIETLRVSIACFPETMFTSSSLSIETIRSYAKKIRHPETQSRRQPVRILPSTSSQPSKWKWPNILKSKRSSNFSSPQEPTEAVLQLPELGPFGVIRTTTLSSPSWMALRAVFPASSDYLCDALYAYLVAYNYIASLCRSPPPSARPPTSLSRQEEGNDSLEIPNKAAALLGLSIVETELAGPHSWVEKKRSGIFNSRGRDSITESATLAVELGLGHSTPSGAGASDSTNREILAGLTKCTARIITTLRTSKNVVEDHLVATEDRTEMDPFFFRSLREIVRRAEESE